MNFQEAHEILELPMGVDGETAKKKYRELTKKYHPDINKEVGAEDKFKKINEAYKIVTSGPAEESFLWSGFNPFSNIRIARDVDISITLSFQESILGCKKELKFNRQSKCAVCSGKGFIIINNNCKDCGGTGTVMFKKGNTIFTSDCLKCQVQKDQCKTCNSTGLQDVETIVSVNIPGGVFTGSILRLSNMGNYTCSFFNKEQHTDANLHINVTPEHNMVLQGADVVSNISISLLEALEGCTKTVNTVLGEKQITIKPLSYHKDAVNIIGLGVNRKGNHKVILDIKYPENTDKLINYLNKGE
jgi:molecular chaperone DnaJ